MTVTGPQLQPARIKARTAVAKTASTRRATTTAVMRTAAILESTE